MTTKKFGLFTLGLPLFILAACTSTPLPALPEIARDVSATQRDTTPYEDLDLRLTMKPGKTFLAFMEQDLKPAIDSQYPKIKQVMSRYPNQYGKWQDILRSDGTGVAVRIDAKNYFFNVAYIDAGDRKNDVKSGRSYGVGPTNKQSDPSYPAFLKDLQQYLEREPESTEVFYRSLMEALVNCDTSGWRKLSVRGQMVATDFITIYAAELYRHLIVKLRTRVHPWEIDFSAVTFLGAFNVASKRVIKDGDVVPGGVEDWNGFGTKGSGVGITRRDRKMMTEKIAEHLVDSRDSTATRAIEAVEEITGETEERDIIQGVFEYLNSPGRDALRLTRQEQKVLVDSMVSYATHLQAQARSIASALERRRR